MLAKDLLSCWPRMSRNNQYRLSAGRGTLERYFPVCSRRLANCFANSRSMSMFLTSTTVARFPPALKSVMDIPYLFPVGSPSQNLRCDSYSAPRNCATYLSVRFHEGLDLRA